MMKPLSTAIIAVIFSFGLAATSEAASVNNTAYLYAGPGYNYAKLLTIPSGANVGLGSCQNAWCQTSYGGRNGWLHQSFVTGAVAGVSEPCRGGPSRCKKSAFGSFALGLAAGAASRNRRGSVGNNGEAPNGYTFYGRYSDTE